ncbi:MAG: SBBP repeat-containing protein, partial [Armatimonadetes bacterium]|nr:SBBP repeat-containing protein [Armatimonadota bacterium]
QETPQGRRLVPGRYVMLGGDLVGFRLGRYDRRQPLVIDPTISFSTFLGSTGTDQALSAATDNAGNLYIAGTTTSTTFPTTAPLQGTNGGGTSDGFVVKVGPNHTVIYATYFGGSGADTAMGVAALNGEAIVCGETASTNFPRQLALQPTLAGGTDAFVSRLASDGRSLVYSTYLGGTATDRLKGIAVDSNGDAYFAGMSNSANFPVANPLQPVLAGNIDGVLVKLDSTGQNLVYATYLGGAAQDDLSGVTINSNGELFATGTTSSADFPTLGAQQAANGGLDDAVVLGLNSGGSALLFSTYLGGSAKEVGGHAPALDPLGNLYVVGATGSTDFPVTSGAAQTTYGGGSADGFVACYTGGGTVLLYATYIGGSADDRLLAVAADAAGQATFGGSTASTDLSTVAPLQPATGGGLDFMLGRLNTAGNTTQFLTYLGGNGTDQFYHGVADANARWHFAGYSASPNFPLSSPIQGAKSTGDDAVFGVVGGFGQQADLQIAAEGSAAVGNDIYNNDGANQTANGNTVVNYRASFTVTLQNDGGIDDVFSVTGPASSGGWTIAYFVPGSPRTDITSEVTTTGYQVAIGAGGQQSLTLEMTPSNAVAEGDSQTVLVTGQSVADASMLDAVGATATVVGPPRLDYTGEPGYEADGVEPDSGTVNSTYVFRATYINPRGAAATGVQLHVRRNGTEIAGSPVAMTSLSGQPLTGVTYQAQVDRSILTGLVKEGTYDYYLTATDGVTAASGPLSVSNAGPIVNNTPPTITNLVLVPAAPLANQDITVSYDYSDADGDPEAGTTFAWRVNGTAVALPPAADQRTLTQDRFGMGDRID